MGVRATLGRVGDLGATLLLGILGGLAIASEDPLAMRDLLLLFDLVAMLYLLVGGMYTWGLATGRLAGSEGQQGRPWRLEGPFRAVIPPLVSFIGLAASLDALFVEGDEGTLLVARVVGVLTMVIAWLMLHVSYGRRYEWICRRYGGGLDFPDQPRPNLVEYLYFAVTLGTTFATSDADVTTRRMRWHVMLHSVLGFFYNAVVLAVAFKFVTGG